MWIIYLTFNYDFDELCYIFFFRDICFQTAWNVKSIFETHTVNECFAVGLLAYYFINDVTMIKIFKKWTGFPTYLLYRVYGYTLYMMRVSKK